MLKRLLLLALLAATLVPLAGCRMFRGDCNNQEKCGYPDCNQR